MLVNQQRARLFGWKKCELIICITFQNSRDKAKQVESWAGGSWALIISQQLIQNGIDFIHKSYHLMTEPANMKKIENYLINFNEKLGQGNFSKCYKAYHEIFHEVYAIKIVELNSLKSKLLQDLLFSEIDILKHLQHPNILRCYEVFTSNRNCYIITQLCNQGDLEAKLKRQSYFSEEEAEKYISDVYMGLKYLAQKNVVHRDFKIANVFLHNGSAKIADFGFARYAKQNFKDANIGSPLYMSPQGVIDHIYGPKTDVWAFGIMIYQIFHGTTPFSCCVTERDLIRKIQIPISKREINQSLSWQIKEFICCCLEVREDRRPAMFDLANTPFMRKILAKKSSNNEVPDHWFNRSTPQNGFSSQIIKQDVQNSKNFVNIHNSTNIVMMNQQSYQLNTPQLQQVPRAPMNHLQVQKPSQERYFSPFETRKMNGLEPASKSTNPKQLKNSPAFNKNREQMKAQSNIGYVPLSYNQRSNIRSRANTSQLILNGFYTFREAVNILHYCRLVYKFIIMSRGNINKGQQEKLGAHLLAIISEIIQKCQKKEIKIDGHNKQVREMKMQEVCEEYYKKYTSELHILEGKSPMKLSECLHYIKNLWNFVDSQIQPLDSLLLIEGHMLIAMQITLKILIECNRLRNYGKFSTFKDIEVFLNTSTEYMNYQSYLIYRAKLTG